MIREGFVDVYRTIDGEKVQVPEHWMDDKVLSRPFRKTPLQRKADEQKATAAKSDTK